MFKRVMVLLLLNVILVLIISSISMAGEQTTAGNSLNTFAATIMDAKNQKTLIYNITFGKGLEKYQEFHGLRGASNITIPFSKVKSVEVLGTTMATSDLYANDKYVNTLFHLTDGHSIEAQIPSDWLWKGETAFGEMSIKVKDIKVITFHHEGQASKCPKCGKIYHFEGFEYCPYDGSKLEIFIEE